MRTKRTVHVEPALDVEVAFGDGECELEVLLGVLAPQLRVVDEVRPAQCRAERRGGVTCVKYKKRD